MTRKKRGSKAEAGGAGAAMPARGKHALFGRRSFNRPGTAPGTLDTAAPPDAPRAAIDVIAYGPERCEMVKVHSLDQPRVSLSFILRNLNWYGYTFRTVPRAMSKRPITGKDINIGM
jgi:hypothetical protein